MAGFTRRHFVSALGLMLGGRMVAPAVSSLWPSLASDNLPVPDKALFQSVLPNASGITWKHVSGRSAERYLPETAGPGCAFIDYDNDGWMDLYLVNSGRCDFYEPKSPLRNALYHNNRDGTFTDVTEKAGVLGGGYGIGAAVADYDGDGFPDLYVTQYGRSILYHNNGDGTFSDITEKAGVAAPGWATSAVWFDYDNDGKLDLLVCRFSEYDKSMNRFCGSVDKGERYYCIPRLFPAASSWLFHNNGDHTFTDVSKESGIAGELGKAWGVVVTDVNNDGWMDVFVSNDTVRNFLFLNQRGKFEEIGFDSGVAYSPDGKARSGMGVDAADYDQDGWADLFVANIDQEKYSLYRNGGKQVFEDVADQLGIGHATRLMSGWGLKFFDYDNDGDIDLFLANGHPDDLVETHVPRVFYKEPLLLFRRNGKALDNMSASAGPVFADSYAARGLAIGDFDNDGAIDVLVGVNDDAPLLLRNLGARDNHWLGVRLIGKRANPEGIGAMITWEAGDLKRTRLKVAGGSYLSSHDPREVLGIGPHKKIDRLEIRWPAPSERVDIFRDVAVDRYFTVVEGTGVTT